MDIIVILLIIIMHWKAWLGLSHHHHHASELEEDWAGNVACSSVSVVTC